jgi:hypothetical protein
MDSQTLSGLCAINYVHVYLGKPETRIKFFCLCLNTLVYLVIVSSVPPMIHNSKYNSSAQPVRVSLEMRSVCRKSCAGQGKAILLSRAMARFPSTRVGLSQVRLVLYIWVSYNGALT